MSRVLVTGAAGFIGSHVVDALIEVGHEVIVVDDLSTGHRRNVKPKAKFYQIDIRSQGLRSIFEHERPEYVNHHAAHIDVHRSREGPLYDASVNVLGSINLLECCRKYGVKKIIYASTGGAVYGEPEHLPCDESHPVRPLSPYGSANMPWSCICIFIAKTTGSITRFSGIPMCMARGRTHLVKPVW